MINNSVDKCKICEGEFYVAKMENGKCQVCHQRFPHAESMDDVRRDREKKLDSRNDGSFDKRVEKRVYEILDDIGALNSCECGKKFFKRSPNQKFCGHCDRETE